MIDQTKHSNDSLIGCKNCNIVDEEVEEVDLVLSENDFSAFYCDVTILPFFRNIFPC